MKFTQRNGKILIKIQYLKKQIEKNTDFLLISVTDNGEGIKKENRKNIFKLFGPNRNNDDEQEVKGIGLGLAISKLIVTKFDGHIDFISKVKKGSTFFFTFRADPYNAQDLSIHEEKISQKYESFGLNPFSGITVSKIPILKSSTILLCR